MEKLALYFGYGNGGHFLRWPTSSPHRDSLDPKRDIPGFPWTIGMLDSGLLKIDNVRDDPDGRVFWTLGGNNPLWFAFYWWDRSGDARGASNSGFYVRGFSHNERHQAFSYACLEWPKVVARQLQPLILQAEG